MARNLPSPQVLHYRVQNFSGGLNSQTEASLVEDNQASDLMNVVFDDKGVVKKRPGVVIKERLANIAGMRTYADQMFDFHRRDGSYERLAFVIGELPDGSTNYNNSYHCTNQMSPSVVSGEEPYQEIPFLSSDRTTPYEFVEPTKKRKWSMFVMNDRLYLINEYDGLFQYQPKGFDPIDLFIPKVEEEPEVVAEGEGEGDPVEPEVPAEPIDWTRHFFKVETNVPPCKMAIVHHDRVFYSGDPNQLDRLYFSELGKPKSVSTEISSAYGKTQSTAGGLIDIHTSDTEITGLGVFFGKLVIFKRNSAFVLSGRTPDVDFALDQVNVADGCISHETIQLGNNFLYYLSSQGLRYLYSPDQQMIETASLSQNIQRELLKQPLEKAFSVFYNSIYYLFTRDFIYFFDENLKAWGKHDIKMRSALLNKETKEFLFSNTQLYIEGDTGVPDEEKGIAYVYEFDETKKNDVFYRIQEVDAELPIRCYYKTRYFDFEEPEIRKRLKFLKVFYRPTDGTGELTLTQEINYRGQQRSIDTSYYSMFWGVSDWGETYGEPVELLSKKVSIGGQGELVRYTFENNKLDQEFKLFGFTVGFKRKQKVR